MEVDGGGGGGGVWRLHLLPPSRRMHVGAFKFRPHLCQVGIDYCNMTAAMSSHDIHAVNDFD
jgi:hypothetical protein